MTTTTFRPVDIDGFERTADIHRGSGTPFCLRCPALVAGVRGGGHPYRHLDRRSLHEPHTARLDFLDSRMSRRRRPARPILTLCALGVLVLGLLAWRLGAAPATAVPDSLPTGTAHGVVERVVDGDTVRIRTDAGESLSVRLIGVDTPETVKPNTPVQCYGPDASAHTKALLPAATSVYLEYDPSQGDTDRYGRTLAYLWYVDTKGTAQILNREIIANGYGREYTYDTPYRYQAPFRDAQNAAQRSDAGLWGACPRS